MLLLVKIVKYFKARYYYADCFYNEQVNEKIYKCSLLNKDKKTCKGASDPGIKDDWDKLYDVYVPCSKCPYRKK